MTALSALHCSTLSLCPQPSNHISRAITQAKNNLFVDISCSDEFTLSRACVDKLSSWCHFAPRDKTCDMLGVAWGHVFSGVYDLGIRFRAQGIGLIIEGLGLAVKIGGKGGEQIED